MLILYGKVSRFWRERQVLNVAFATVNALKPEAAVRYNGVEIGRVRNMRILHLDQANLARLKYISRADLEYLPLSNEQRRELRLVPDYDFEKAVKQALADKTMIVLTLEVLVEGHYRRYRVDDSVRISATILGDTSIEIVSGNGRPVEPEEDAILLGTAGDFFQNLARSVDQVKEVLSSVTDVVGAEERAAFKRSTSRLDDILAHVEGMTRIAETRVSATKAKLDGLDGTSTGAMDSIGRLFERLQPDSSRLYDSVAQARKDLGERFERLQAETGQAREEVEGAFGEIRADVRYATDKSAPHLEVMKENLRKLALKLGGVTGRVGNMDYYASRSIEESLLELNRGVEALKTGADNLKSLRYIREITDKLISKSDLGEHNFYTLLDTVDRLQRLSREPRDTAVELERLRPYVHAYLEPRPPVTEAELDRIEGRLRAFENDIAKTRDLGAGTYLPPFTGAANGSGEAFPRKRAGRVEIPVK
ncbi:MAG: MlaD family protein [Planctomycetota bacterium]|nr:MlaD family protein [Planctomycetota bacterium]